MPDWLVKILAVFYVKIPKNARPFIKSIFFWGLIRIQALFSLKKIVKVRQVQFLDFEIAHLENIEILGPGAGEVLVRAEKSIVSPGTETAVLTGLPGARKNFPYSPGYSLAGTIIKVGKKVTHLKIGDRVVGQINHMSHQVVKANKLFKIPEGVSFDEASFMELAIICLQGIRKSAICPGDRVAIVGQGLIGQFSNKLAKICGASSVIAVAASRNREKSAVADDSADKYIALKENKITPDEIQADVVIEAVGSPKGIETAFRCAKNEGKVTLLGSSRGIGRNVDWNNLVQKKNLTVIGAHISDMPEKDISPKRWTYKEEGNLFLKLLKEKRLNISNLITWKAKPEECNKVYEILAEGGGEQVGIMFEWN
jgi:2-desacetyl-2-hydroxyethyl bacteriochlorophyllide A dehydrogenase